MFKNQDALKEMLKNKPVDITQDNENLVITNKKTNQAMFVLKLTNNKCVNLKKADVEALEALPEVSSSETRTIGVFQLVNKITRINFCQGKPVIEIFHNSKSVKINNHLNNTSYELPVVNDEVTLSLTDYKAIRNPKHIDETGNPIPLKDVVKKHHPDLGMKKVKQPIEVETHRTIDLIKLRNKINRINQIACETTIILHRPRSGFVKITSLLTDPHQVIRLEITDNTVQVPIEFYKTLRVPQKYDEHGNPISVTDFLKSLPKQPRKKYVRKQKAKKETKVVKTVKKVYEPITWENQAVPAGAILIIPLKKLLIKVIRINKKSKKYEYTITDTLFQLNNTIDNVQFNIPLYRENGNSFDTANQIVITTVDYKNIK